MKNIHPKYYPEAKVTCSCGNTFTTGSTMPEIHVEICSSCHPFFTGEMKFVDTQGRVERFQEWRQRAAKLNQKNPKKAKKAETVVVEEPKSLKEMMTAVRNSGDNQAAPKTVSR